MAALGEEDRMFVRWSELVLLSLCLDQIRSAGLCQDEIIIICCGCGRVKRSICAAHLVRIFLVSISDGLESNTKNVGKSV